MQFRFILLLLVILLITCPTNKQPESKSPISPPFWYGPEYKDILENLKANGFTSTEIDSMFYAADSGRQKFLRKRLAEDLTIQIFLIWLQIKYPFIPKNILLTALKGPKIEPPLLSEESIKLGKQFLKDHQSLLCQLEKQYGVQKEIIVAVVRIETFFGNNLGQYHVFNIFDSIISKTDTLTKTRKWLRKWIKEEMIALFIICRNNRLDISQMMGSRMGAIGLTQFMPTSYSRLSIDGDGDGLINLFQWHDALASTSYYLKKAGWRKTNPIKINKKALFKYNRDWDYVNKIVAYARKIGFKQ